MKKSIKKFLGIEEIERRLNDVESKLERMEKKVDADLNFFGDYKRRTNSQLNKMGRTLDIMIETIELLIKEAETGDIIKYRAKPILKRLRNNRTRIINAKMQKKERKIEKGRKKTQKSQGEFRKNQKT